MAARKIIGAVAVPVICWITNVKGRSIATPLTDPNPGIAPTNSPITTPRNAKPRLTGWKASSMPLNSRLTMSKIGSLVHKLVCRPASDFCRIGALLIDYKKMSYRGINAGSNSPLGKTIRIATSKKKKQKTGTASATTIANTGECRPRK